MRFLTLFGSSLWHKHRRHALRSRQGRADWPRDLGGCQDAPPARGHGHVQRAGPLCLCSPLRPLSSVRLLRVSAARFFCRSAGQESEVGSVGWTRGVGSVRLLGRASPSCSGSVDSVGRGLFSVLLASAVGSAPSPLLTLASFAEPSSPLSGVQSPSASRLWGDS